VESEFGGFRARRHVCLPLNVTGNLNSRFCARLITVIANSIVAITVEEIVVANRKIKEISRLNA